MRTNRRSLPTALLLGCALVVGLALPAAAAPGDVLWSKTYNGDGLNEYGSYTAVSRDGTLTFVGGSAQRVSGNQRDMLVVAYEAATGTQKWVRRIAAPGEFTASVYGIVASPTADLLFVTGPRGSATTNNDWLTLALSTTTGDRKSTRLNSSHT